MIIVSAIIGMMIAANAIFIIMFSVITTHYYHKEKKAEELSPPFKILEGLGIFFIGCLITMPLGVTGLSELLFGAIFLGLYLHYKV